VRTPSTTAPDFDSCRAGSACARPSRSLSFSRSVSTFALPALLIAVALTLGVASASAAEYKHAAVVAEFGSDGTPATDFGSVNNLAYQKANKRLYVLSSGKISGFSIPTPGTFTSLGGSFPLTISGGGGDSDIAVDNSVTASANNIYMTPDSSELRGFSSAGAVLAGWPVSTGGETCGVSVDNEGHIWGSRFGGPAAREWNPSGGSPIAEFTRNASQGGPCKIAIDQSNNDIYLSAYGSSDVYKYTKASSYTTSTKVTAVTGSNNRVAINGAKRRLYVGNPSSSNVLAIDTETGALLETINVGEPVRGLAVNEENDTLYVTGSTKNRVREIPGANVAKATTGVPTGNFSVSGTADLNGAGPITECYFEFGPTTSYGAKQNCNETLPINSTQGVSATLPGLEGEVTYHYRLVVVNAERGSNGIGGDQTITPHPVQDVKVTPPTEVTQTGATLNGSFTGNGSAQSYYFEWGPTSSYGNTVGGPAGNGTGTVSVSESITGLSVYLPASLPYHYRLVVTNSVGTTKGPDNTFFAAPPDLPAISDISAENVTPAAANLKASINPGNGATVYLFQFGTGSAYGSTTLTSESIGDDNTAHPVSTTLSGLAPGTTYHFRAVAINFGGVSHSADQTFTTPDLPRIESSASSAVGQTSAHLTASVAGNASPTDVRFEYGTSVAYGQSTPSASAGEDLFGHSVDADVSGLAPGTTYHYRVVAINGIGTSNGPDQTFTTKPVQLGPGQEERKPCPRGKVRRGGKCVKKHRRHGKHRKHGQVKRNG
jgi:hypothetical protein